MSTLQIISLPDPYDPICTRHLICRRNRQEGTLLVLANHPTREAAQAWIGQRYDEVKPQAPRFLGRNSERESRGTVATTVSVAG